jgi:uncharacterized protein (DUF305 family)
MKIDYKITTIVLAGILLVTYAWHWNTIFFHDSADMKMGSMNMKNMHMMPNGKMMSNDRMNMGNMNMDGGMMDMTMSDMVKMMDGKTGKTLEKEFIAGMIPHHQGAVDMANKLLADPTVSQQLKNFANQIITAQEREIKMMNEWLKNY